MAEKADVLRKIRAMLDRAEHPNTPPEEADTARKMADELMYRYTIEEFELEFAKPSHAREKPQMRVFKFFGDQNYYSIDQEIRNNFYRLFRQLALFCGVKVGILYTNEASIVGYERDLDYLDLMYTKIRMHMSMNLDPTPDPIVTWQENLARLKRAGFKWEKIHYTLAKADLKDYPYTGQRWERKIGVRFTKVFTDYCKAHGEFRLYDSPDVWRRSFTEGYVHEVATRIRDLERLRGGYSGGKELVLANRDEDLLNALWDYFPNLKPHPAGCDCDSCHYCGRPGCKRVRCENARRPVRSSRAQIRAVQYSAHAAAAGRKAGATVDLSSGGLGGRRKEIQ